MIAKRIRKGPRQKRPVPPAMARKLVGLLTYAVNADRTFLMTAEGVERLTQYALDDRLTELGVEAGEKVAAHGARNLYGTGLLEWQAQMLAVAMQNPRSRDPIEHIVMSWRSGEQPTEAQMNEAVDIMLDVLGCASCQVVWAAHSNTDHRHVHLVINRVDPMTHRMVQLGDGWDLDRLAQGCALIEHRQGWDSENNSIYSVNDRGEVVQVVNDVCVRDANGTQLRRAGGRAAERAVALDNSYLTSIQERLRTSRNWNELHVALGDMSATFTPKGSGATIVDALKVEHRASYFGKDCSWRALVARLGDYVEPDADKTKATLKEHQAAVTAENRRIRDARAAAWAGLSDLENSHRRRIHAQLSEQKARARADKTLVAELRAAKAALAAEYDRCLAAVDAARITPSEWAQGRRSKAPNTVLPTVIFPADPLIEKAAAPVPTYRVATTRSSSAYYSAGQRTPVFVDHGKLIIVHTTSDADILAALRLGAERWGVLTLSGNVDRQMQCLRIAAEHGIVARGSGLDKSAPAKVAAGSNSPPTKMIPFAEAQRPSGSCYPPIYVIKPELDTLRGQLRANGFDVGMKAAVRFDRSKQHFLIVDEGLGSADRHRLVTILAPYMTDAARQRWLKAEREPARVQGADARPAAAQRHEHGRSPSTVGQAQQSQMSGPAAAKGQPSPRAVAAMIARVFSRHGLVAVRLHVGDRGRCRRATPRPGENGYRSRSRPTKVYPRVDREKQRDGSSRNGRCCCP